MPKPRQPPLGASTKWEASLENGGRPRGESPGNPAPDAVTAWFGLVAPRGAPPEVIARAKHALRAGLERPEAAARLFDLGARPLPGPPEAYQARDVAEFAPSATRSDGWASAPSDALASALRRTSDPVWRTSPRGASEVALQRLPFSASNPVAHDFRADAPPLLHVRWTVTYGFRSRSCSRR